MKRWDGKQDVESPAADAFIEEIIAVCKRHGFSIGHEDGHGAFELQDANELNFDWLREATLRTRSRA